MGFVFIGVETAKEPCRGYSLPKSFLVHQIVVYNCQYTSTVHYAMLFVIESLPQASVPSQYSF